MRIGINCQTILNPASGENAGVGHYTYYLVKNLLRIDKKNQYVLFFDDLIGRDSVREIIGKNKNAEARFFSFHKNKLSIPFVYTHLLFSALVEREKLDVFHAPANIVPLNYKGKAVVTVHDLAIYKHPEWFPENFLKRRVSTKLLVPRAIKKAYKVIAVSESTKKDIVKLFKTVPAKIKVIYEGVDTVNIPDVEKIVCGTEEMSCQSDFLEKYKIKKDYILFLGTIEPRKNLVPMINAFGKVMKKNKALAGKYQFLIAGARGWKFVKTFKVIDKVNEELRKIYPDRGVFVKYLGYIPHRDKLPALAGAAVFVFPSLYEGFGLPVLEAMNAGAPVITSKISSLPEVAGQAGILINPNNEKDLERILEKVLKSPSLRKKMSREGKKRAGEFSWEKMARETLGVYKSLK